MCLARTLAHSLSEMTAFWGIAATPPRIDAPPSASAPRITSRRSRPFGASLGSDIYVSPEQNFLATEPGPSITGCQTGMKDTDVYLSTFIRCTGLRLNDVDSPQASPRSTATAQGVVTSQPMLVTNVFSNALCSTATWSAFNWMSRTWLTACGSWLATNLARALAHSCSTVMTA